MPMKKIFHTNYSHIFVSHLYTVRNENNILFIIF